MSVCFSTTEDKRWKWVAWFRFPLLSSLIIFYKNCMMASLVCSLLFLSISPSLSRRCKEGENDDHHVIFVVTIEVCIRVYSRFFFAYKRILSVLVHHYPSLIYMYIYISFLHILTCRRTGLIIFNAFLIGYW